MQAQLIMSKTDKSFQLRQHKRYRHSRAGKSAKKEHKHEIYVFNRLQFGYKKSLHCLHNFKL